MLRMPAAFAQGSQGAGAVPAFLGTRESRRSRCGGALLSLPPLMIRGGIAKSPNHASPYGKGRWHEVPEGIRVNPQKGRHLLCSFCPYEMRSSFGRDSSDGYYVAFAQSLGHVLMSYTPVGLYAGSLSRPRLTPETSVVPAYSKFGDRNFAPSGQRGRRDLAAYAARTRLSLR